MKFAKRFLLLCGVLLLALAGPASAQYMFIDADGNGLPGAGDVMQANGVVTNAAVYLYTNRDRIGTTRTCNDGTSTIDLFAYAVNLEATGGTVDYGTFTTNAFFPTNFLSSDPNDGTRAFISFGNTSGNALAEGGPHQLFTIPITGQTGSPKVDIVISNGLGDPTYFGTHCVGDFMGLQTWFLTTDVNNGDGEWTDADGLPAAGGVVNQDPILAAIGNKSVNEGSQLAFTATATDADTPPQPLTFSLTLGTPAATGASITTGGAFSWTPTEEQGPGVYPVTITVDDGAGGNDSELINITANEVNQAPTLNAIGNKTVNEGVALNFLATAIDLDIPANTLTFSLTLGSPAATGASISAGGSFTWTPTEAQGPGVYPITINVTDGTTPDNELINVTVNEVNVAPVLAAIGNKTVTEGSPLNFTATATDADLPPNTLTFSLTLGSPAATGASINASTGAFTWTPNNTQGGSVYPITIAVTDNGTPPMNDNELIQVTVNEGVNLPPVLAAIGNKTVAEGSLLAFTATATDPELQPLTFSLTLGSPAATGASITTGGAFSWTPTEAQGPGVYPITIAVSDGSNTDDELIQVTVTEVNVAPVLAAIGNKTATESQLLTFTATATDADLPPNALTFSLTLGSPAATGASITTGGVFTWTPNNTQGSLVYPITIIVTDNGTPPLNDTELIQVTVNESANTAPVLDAIGNKTVAEGSLLAFTATATDGDTPAQTLAFTLTLGSPAATGASINASTGAFSWTPTEAQGPGVYPITVVVTDNGTPPANDSELINVTVTEVNVAPILAAIGNKTVAEGSLLAFTATATDADLPPNTLTFSLTLGSPAATGASITTGGAFSWTPTEAQGPGVYPITVAVSDGALSDDEQIQVTVTEVNQAPILAAIGNQTATVGVELAFTATATDADLPPNALTFSLTLGSPAATGASINASTGAFTWTPSSTGIYPVTITVTDNGTPPLDDSELINISVGIVNAAPELAAIGNKTVDEGSLLAFTATATDTDLPPQTLAFSLTLGSPAATGASINATTGAFSWTPTEAQGPGVYPITVEVTDGIATDSELIQVTVNEVNVAPILAAIGNKTVDENSPLAFTATATDGDLPPQSLTFSLTLGTPEATGASINASTGAFSWTPGEAQGGDTYPITIAVSDGSLSDEETIQVQVNDVNSAPILAAIGDKSASVGVNLAFKVTATDNDIPTNDLTFTLDAPTPAGMGIDPITGDFNWTPADADVGANVVTFRVTDNGIPEMFDTETITITVSRENRGPTLTQPSDMTVDEGATADQQLTGTDPDGDPLTFAKVTGPTFMTVSTINATTGNVHLAPTFSDSGNHPASVSASDGLLSDTKSFSITVNNVNRAPVANAGGPYVGTINVAVSFNGTGSSDPDGDALTYSWTFGDGANGSGAMVSHAYTNTGDFDVTLTVSDGSLSDDDQTTARITDTLAAEAFFIGGNKTTRLGAGKPTTCAQIEPANDSFSVQDIDLTSIVMKYGGGQISALAGKTAINSDSDKDGIQEVEACFSKEDLRILFASLPSGDNQVDVVIEGSLVSGAKFSATTSHRVVVSGKALAVNASPNPFNPATAITFSTTRTGRVTAQIYDISGRLVRTLEDRSIESGVHTLHWDGSMNSGGRVASGVYFFKLRSPDGEAVQRLTVMK